MELYSSQTKQSELLKNLMLEDLDDKERFNSLLLKEVRQQIAKINDLRMVN
jgi:hypothetical protein